MQNERKYWFPAKRYGYGWGIPSSWQGWLVLAVFVALLGVGRSFFRPTQSSVLILPTSPSFASYSSERVG